MKKIFIPFLMVFLLFFTSCFNPNNFEENNNNKHYNVTIINYTDKIINYSIIEGNTACTSGKDFYASSHNYIRDYYRGPLYQSLLCAYGTVKENDLLDREYLWLPAQNCYVTVFVCKDNTYTTKPHEYIGKGYIYITGDRTITISANGQVY